MESAKGNDVSIIIASSDCAETIEQCIRALENQSKKELIREIIVADCSSDGTRKIIEERFPSVSIISFKEKKLIPVLWSAGIMAAQGSIAATTTAHFIPAQDWIENIVETLNEGYAGVGGAIENDADASLGDWGLYFCRYSKYMPPFDDAVVTDIPADNAAYRRDILLKYSEMIKDGFWENFVNNAMARDGERLSLTPKVVVVHKKSFGVMAFAKQRFIHGVRYGRERSRKFTALKRICFAAASPAIPFLYLKRIGGRVFSRRRYIDKFILSFPVLILFLFCWGFGEGCGYLGIYGSNAIKE